MEKGPYKWLAFGLASVFALSGVSTATLAGDNKAAATTSEMESPAAENADLTAIGKAMQGADAPTLIKLYQESKDPIVHVWAAMALERVHFNLDAATADALTCERSLFDTYPAVALQCGQFRAGNLHLAGRPADGDAVERELITRYRGHRVERQLDSMQAYLDQSASVPSLSYDLSAGDVELPLKDTVSVPTIAAKANGHDIDLMLDTGASDLILGEEQARHYGVKPLDKSGHLSGWLSQGVPAKAGLLDSLQLGTITLHNVPVTVVPQPFALMGANLMAPLGTLRFSSKSVLIYGNDTSPPACETPMLAGSGLWGTGLRLLPQLLVNDQPQSVMLDTGASRYLIGTREALDEVTVLHRQKSAMRDIGGNHTLANAQSAKVKLTIADQPFDMLFEVYTDSTSIRHPITLGAGALRDMDFLLDFRHQHMCFLLHPNLH
ncbi:aspartyl protease family protein [Dyella sp. 20L07]|uniref:aspartyl protease family protein n=1 Tax=Dyella sp. 20L07 TaxID=3384240 RepID=UPI003D27BB81